LTVFLQEKPAKKSVGKRHLRHQSKKA